MWRYDDLAIFIAVVERGSFIAAANKTNIPSSTVSRRLSRLEADLKIKLMERTSRRIHLTEKGKIFYEQCAPLIHQLSKNAKALTESINNVHGKLKVTVPTYIGNNIMADIFMDYIKINPKIELEIVLSNGIEDIIDEEIDIAIRVGPLQDSNFIAQKLWEFDFILCANPEYLSTNKPPENPEDLNNHYAIVPDTQPFPWRFRRRKSENEYCVSPQNRLMLNDMSLSIHAVNNGVGVACIPRMYVQEKLNTGELIELMPQYEILNKKTAYAVYPDKQYLPKKHRLFINYIKEKTAIFNENINLE